MKHNIYSALFLSGSLSIFSITADAALALDITNIVIQDSGDSSIHAITAGSSGNVGTVTGDLNLTSFTVGGTVHNTSGYVSGVGTATNLTSSNLGRVIQPGEFIDEGDANAFYTGTTVNAPPALDNAGAYLVSGERGLSFSTALNFQADSDPQATLTIPLSFLSNPVSATSRPTIIIGDGANNQTDDVWSFYDTDGPTDVEIARFTVSGTLGANPPGDWSSFGTQTVDRIRTDGTGTVVAIDDDRDLGLNIIALNLEESDFTIVGGTSADWTLIDEVRITLPGSGSGGPATDIAFFGIDTGIVLSSLAVVPEPSATSLIVAVAVFGFVSISRRKLK